MNSQDNNTKKRVLFLFTLHYPYHYSDSYIDTLVLKLSKEFDTIVCYSHNSDNTPERVRLSNMHSKRVNVSITKWDYFKAPFYLLSRTILQEILNLKLYDVTFSISRLKTMLHYFIRAKKVEQIMLKDFREYCDEKSEVFVYGHFLTDFTLAASFLKSKMKSRIFARLHGADLYFDRELNGYLPFRKLLFDSSDKFFFISEGGKSYFCNKLKLNSSATIEKTKLNYLGVQNSFSRLLNQRSPKNQFSIVTNSWTVPLKRLELVIEAVKLIPNTIEVVWTHFGDHGFVFYDYYNNLVSQWNVLQETYTNVSVHLMGSVKREEIFNFYHRHKVDVFINVSSTEGIPITMMEAMSFAIPVIGTRVGGVPEIISDDENGRLLPANPTPQEIAERLLFIYSLSDIDYNRMSETAYHTWDNRFNSDKNEIDFISEMK